MLKIGMVGCGTHANWAVVPAITGASDRWQLAAVCDVNAQNLDSINAGPATRFTDHRKMIADSKLDAIYVATLADTHAQIALDAIAAGLHVVCEKPMATSLDDCRRMVAASAKDKRTIAVNFETRYHPEARAVKKWITDGLLGRIEAIHMQNFWDGHKIEGAIGARRKRLVNLAGALDCGIHKADLIRYFCGGDWAEIVARGRWFSEDVNHPPHISILGTLTNGVMATLNASLSYTAYIPNTAYSDMWTIVGSDGVINHFDERHGTGNYTLTSRTKVETLTADHTGHAEVMVMLLRDFADVIEGKGASAIMATAVDGLQAQILVNEANRQSNETKPAATGLPQTALV